MAKKKKLKERSAGNEDLSMTEAIERGNIEGVSYSLNELNKWNVNLRIWHINQRVSVIWG